ncbi:Ca-activated chloride channel family protein [Alkalispirochaeta americana]|uniref:Ca-activated chloride channel family protein n=1 Tax=Alkalispirochaeta americana TaxID=159291 RepID=A0A1N6UFU1_9SPIO|nr:VWA domain-containing protein [Alkalispirochaeta americana]SIQ64196.1 Ca-activated chloride channel family protein [Alkalispirochaeta americana]
MTFLYPVYLWLLLGVPLVMGLLLFAAWRSREALTAYLGGKLLQDALEILVLKNFISAVLFTMALALLVVSLGGPQWGSRSVEEERRGLELVFLVDVSNSMLVEDVLPSRLARTREVARSVASRFPEASKGIVVFKGGSSVLVPLTGDPAAFDLAISYLSPSLVTSPGTDLNEALPAAADLFPGGTPRHRVILLFSDGGHDLGVSRQVLEDLRDRGTPVFTVLTGTPAGGTIPATDGGVLRDGHGDPVIVGVNSRRMEEIASVTGGKAYSISETTIVNRLVQDLEHLSGEGVSVLFRQVSVDRYHLFVLAALGLLVVMILVQSFRWRDLL